MRCVLCLFLSLASVGVSSRLDAAEDPPGSWVRPDLDRLSAGKRQIRPFEDGGQAEVRIDGAVVGVVDQYGPARRPTNPPVGAAIPFEWKHKGLAPGNHTLTIRTLPEKNSASTGDRITVARIEPAP